MVKTEKMCAYLFLKHMSWAPRPHLWLDGLKAYRNGRTPHMTGSSSLDDRIIRLRSIMNVDIHFYLHANVV